VTDVFHWVLLLTFAFIGLGCILLVIMQLPGTWLMLMLGMGVQAADEWWLLDNDAQPGWWALGIGLALALLGEIIETAAGAAGTKAGGGRRRGMWGAIIGAMGGAVIGTVALPIPVVGSLIGAIAGAFVGAVIGEMSGGQARSLTDALKPATGAAVGRAAGTLVKCGLASVVWVVLVIGFALN